VAEVTQNTFMFEGTVKENITFGKLDATDAEIVTAAKIAYAHDFIKLLPQKYETKVGERGVGLSGGQLQRISLARAIVRRHNILILDEATSALDIESDYYIQKALKTIMKNTTTIIIAHRLSTIHHVDQIVVLDQGKIVQKGNHKTLYAKKTGAYRKLHDLMEVETRKQAVQIPY
jgi:subfamily B ATP-binding cassette protein MsbA